MNYSSGGDDCVTFRVRMSCGSSLSSFPKPVKNPVLYRTISLCYLDVTKEVGQ